MFSDVSLAGDCFIRAENFVNNFLCKSNGLIRVPGNDTVPMKCYLPSISGKFSWKRLSDDLKKRLKVITSEIIKINLIS